MRRRIATYRAAKLDQWYDGNGVQRVQLPLKSPKANIFDNMW